MGKNAEQLVKKCSAFKKEWTGSHPSPLELEF